MHAAHGAVRAARAARVRASPRWVYRGIDSQWLIAGPRITHIGSLVTLGMTRTAAMTDDSAIV